MNNQEYFKNKLLAFFHDPLNKPLCIQNHKEQANAQLSTIGIEYKEIKEADWISSAADRFPNQKVLDKDTNEKKLIIVDFDKEGELTHPLGSQRLLLTPDRFPIQIDKEKVKIKVITFLEEMKEECGDDYKKMFLYLWRYYPMLIKEEKENKIGKLWNFLPAETRMPDHSILSHNFLTSAIDSCGKNIAFIKFSIGPVQSFISTARKTEDFWMGSYLLSYLISKGIEVIIDELGPDHIIFPNIKNQPLIDYFIIKKYKCSNSKEKNFFNVKLLNPSLPNVVFFLAPQEEHKDILTKIEDTIKKVWEKDIALTVREKFFKKLNGINTGIAINQYEKQIKNFIRFYSSAVHLNEKELEGFISFFGENINKNIYTKKEDLENLKQKRKGYNPNIGSYWKEIYEYIDRVFASNKLIRKFNYIEISGRKCTMCGERSALTDKEETAVSNRKLKEFWKKLGTQTSNKIDEKGKERLCAICLTKRLSKDYVFKDMFLKSISYLKEDKDFLNNLNFPSTATIASWPFKIACIKNWNRLEPLFIEYYNILKNKSGIFGNRYPEHINKECKKAIKNQKLSSDSIRNLNRFLSMEGEYLYLDFIDSENKNEKISLKKFLQATNELNIKPPLKYYALLRMDGDSMGKWLSGTHQLMPQYKDVLHSKAVKMLQESVDKFDKFFLEKTRAISPALHSFISSALNEFSLNTVSYIVENMYPGKLIYSGGDDVLALLPFDYALECAERIRYEFSGNINKDSEIDLDIKTGYYLRYKNTQDTPDIIATMGNNATMSAGIIYAHIKEEFRTVIKKSQIAEHNAKEGNGRNAFYINIKKHSGNELGFGLKWDFIEKDLKIRTNKILHEILKFFPDQISMNFFSSAYELLSKIQVGESEMVNVLLVKELNDHCIIKDTQERIGVVEEVFQYLKLLLKIYNNSYEKTIENKDETYSLLTIFKALRFFVSKGEK